MTAPTDMIIQRDVTVIMNDGVRVRGDVFRPRSDDLVPVLMSLGPYGKGIAYQDGYAPEWEWLIERHPEILDGSSGTYMVWEVVDPERFVPDGYAVLRVDSRGSGRSEGVLDLFSPREVRDYYEMIEWAGTQPWSNGKVGLIGVSYYAIAQWQVAALQPPHLAAIVPWDGMSDLYREFCRHGGIMSNGFFDLWYPGRVLRNQHGMGTRGMTDEWLGEPAAGPETLSDSELTAHRTDFPGEVRDHRFDDEFYRSRSPDLTKVTVPLLSAANWEGSLHPRGNFAGFADSTSTQKWLEVHGGRHEEFFYLPEYVDLQKRFLAHFLQGADNGWDDEAPVLLHVRHPGERFVLRREKEWPLARTDWVQLLLAADSRELRPSGGASSSVSFDALSEGVTFFAQPFSEETEITGPLAATLFVSSSTTDADLFLSVLGFDADGTEITFQGTLDPAVPLAHGWLRASQRKEDERRSKPWQPYHTHDVAEPLEPGAVYTLRVEIWPTCIVMPAGSRLALNVAGRDFSRGESGPAAVKMHGSGPFIHNSPDDRPGDVYGGVTTIHTGGAHESSLLVPLIPAQ